MIESNIKQPGSKKNLSRSATRALDILEYFAMVGRPLRATEISQALEFNASSTDQLLKTMVDSAYLVFDAEKKLYYPSPRLVNFGSWLSANYFGGDRIWQLLQFLHQETGHIVTLSIRHGPSMQIVDYYEPVTHAGTVVKGSQVPIMDSLIGTAFLSLHGEREVITIVDQINHETGARMSVAELRNLLMTVAHARDKGYVSGPASDGAPWAMAVGLPLPESGIKIVLGMASETIVDKELEDRLIQVIKTTFDS